MNPASHKEKFSSILCSILIIIIIVFTFFWGWVGGGSPPIFFVCIQLLMVYNPESFHLGGSPVASLPSLENIPPLAIWKRGFWSSNNFLRGPWRLPYHSIFIKILTSLAEKHMLCAVLYISIAEFLVDGMMEWLFFPSPPVKVVKSPLLFSVKLPSLLLCSLPSFHIN